MKVTLGMTGALTVLVLLTLYVSLPLVSAQVMESTNYQIQSDSVNLGGGLSSSTNYVQESTVGEVATGELDSTNYAINAGYQQMQEVYIAITAAADVSMTPAIPGITGGTSNGSTTVTVTTDSTAGYQLTIEAENNPAMQSGANSIADYNPGGDPDFTFNYGASDALLGYSPSGADVTQRFLDNGADTCSSGSTDTPLRCWDGLTTSGVAVAVSAGPNHPEGATTTVNFQVGIGGAVGQPLGVYYATTTLTAVAL